MLSPTPESYSTSQTCPTPQPSSPSAHPFHIDTSSLRAEVKARVEISRNKAKEAGNTHDKQRGNDRTAVKLYIDKHKNKLATATIDDKWAMLTRLRDQKLRERVLDGRGSTWFSFPGEHNQPVEDRWLLNKYREFLFGKAKAWSIRDEDQDDDEPTPMLTGRFSVEPRKGKSSVNKVMSGSSGLKYAESEDDSGSDLSDEVEDGDAEEGNGNEDTEDKDDGTPTTCTACSRGVGIQMGISGGEGVKDEMDPEEGAAEIASPKQGIKRSWVWKDGEMQIFPPF